jgi:hypothetical protein
MKLKFITSILLFLFISAGTGYSQSGWWKDKKYKSREQQQKFDNCKYTFLSIADGFMYANSSYIYPYFHNEIYISIKTGDKGYYNRDQAKYIIEDFLSAYPPDSFKWKNSYRSDSYAFANGKYMYKKEGYVSKYGISVSLKYINDLWLIDQIIIN